MTSILVLVQTIRLLITEKCTIEYICVVEGTSDVLYGVVASAAYEALSQFDSENDSVNLLTVKYVSSVAEVTDTFLSTFQDEMKRQKKVELHASSSNHPTQHPAVMPDASDASNEGQIVAVMSEVTNASMEDKPVHVRTICYCACELNLASCSVSLL